ncbi:hypothetical protein ACQSAK_28715 [Klebsiella pneumoniae]
MGILSVNEQKEQQRINELEQKIKREKAKLDKKLTRQKILLGAFMIDALENNKVAGLRSYTAENLEGFLTRKGDKELMEDLILRLNNNIQS